MIPVNLQKPWLTPQVSVRRREKRSHPLHQAWPPNLSELDQSNLRPSRRKKQSPRGCALLQGRDLGRGGEGGRTRQEVPAAQGQMASDLIPQMQEPLTLTHGCRTCWIRHALLMAAHLQSTST